jgi:transcription elongation regulator 1
LFIELLDEVHAPKLRLDEFSRKYRRDRRFMGLDARERERLFKEHSKGFADRKKKQDEKLKQDFIQLLRETKNITKKSRWSQVGFTLLMSNK